MDANRRIPALSPSASAHASPRMMPTSSTVWWASTSRSPAASTVRSNPPCRPNWLEHVVEEGEAGETSMVPGPVDVQGDLDRGLLGAPLPRGGPAPGGRHVASLCGTLRAGRPGTGRSPRGVPDGDPQAAVEPRPAPNSPARGPTVEEVLPDLAGCRTAAGRG